MELMVVYGLDRLAMWSDLLHEIELQWASSTKLTV